MKKKVLAAISAMAIAGVIGFAFTQSGVVNADPNLTADDIRKQVQEQYPGTITELELEKKGNKVVYEVEIELEEKEYDLKIDGDSGEVLKLEETVLSNNTAMKEEAGKEDDKSSEKLEFIEKKEIKEDNGKQNSGDTDNHADKQNVDVNKGHQADKKASEVKQNSKDDQQNKKTSDSAKNTVISLEEAKKISLNNFSGTIIEIELDDDDGRLIYEVEMEEGESEAEIEIDAYTGEVILLEIEMDDDDD